MRENIEENSCNIQLVIHLDILFKGFLLIIQIKFAHEHVFLWVLQQKLLQVLNKIALRDFFYTLEWVLCYNHLSLWQEITCLLMRLTAVSWLPWCLMFRHGQGMKGEAQHYQSHTAPKLHTLGFLHIPCIHVHRPHAFWKLLSNAGEQECIFQAIAQRLQLYLDFSLFSVKNWLWGWNKS